MKEKMVYILEENTAYYELKKDKSIQMLKVAICDDGVNVCVEIENMIMRYAKKNRIDVEINVWHAGDGLKKYLAGGNYLDILFLDIELYKMTGIEVGNYIRNQLDNTGMQIIYISGNPTYAQQLFKTQPLDFLVKPILQEQIDEVLERAIKIIQRKKIRFEFQQGKEHYYIPLSDIMYFESSGRKVKVNTQKTKFDFYGKLAEVEKNLDEGFIAIHQSFLVNREYIFRYSYENVELSNGTILPISPTKRKKIREILLKEA